MSDQPPSDQPPSTDQPRDNARARARDLLRRTAPMLRDVNAAIDQNGALRVTRDAIIERAGELVQKADGALGKMTAIEGTVVERGAADPHAATPAAGSAAGGMTPTRAAGAATGVSESRPHWTRQRLARMASAAATEAVRPHSPIVSRRAKLSIAAAASALVGLLLLRRRRRR